MILEESVEVLIEYFCWGSYYIPIVLKKDTETHRFKLFFLWKMSWFLD